ncbi:alpha/beta fold hydrolase [Candidatus Auribacterota bacterium]
MLFIKKVFILAAGIAGIFLLNACAGMNPLLKYNELTKEKLPYKERVYPYPERYMDMDGYELCYIEEGDDDGIPLLILPGVNLSVHNWRHNLPRYVERYKVYCIDFPGYGKSGIPDVDYKIEFFTGEVLKFMEKKGLKKVNLLGHSLGGQVAIDLAAKYPEKVNRLILETATGIRVRYGPIEDILIFTFVTEDRFAELPLHKLREYTELNFYNICDACEELFFHQAAFKLHKKGTEEFERRNRAFVRGVRNIILTSVRDKAKKIKNTSLIIWGRDDGLCGVKNAYFLNKEMVNSRLFVIENCGHQPHLERPVDYDEALINFLDEGRSFLAPEVEEGGG